MLKKYRLFVSMLTLCLGLMSANAQTSCCASGSKAKTQCAPDSQADVTGAETTSGCTPSNCRGAKTKFGEAKVISELRSELIAVKEILEQHKDYKFSNEAITVHDMVGETDDESLTIVSDHVAVIESELYSFLDQEVPMNKPTENKATHVKQLQSRLSKLKEAL